MSRREDVTLNRLLQQGDKCAFAEFYESLWEPLFGYVAKIIQEKEETMDIVQESFIAVWKQREALGNIQSVQAYTFSIARFKALRHIRLNIQKRDFQSSMLQFFDSHTGGADERLIADELQRAIDLGVDSLPPKMREVFMLRRNDHLTYQEIAKKLNISDKTVKKQINNALRILRVKLDGSYPFAFLLASVLSDA
ncbi:RNA polymerase sigma factor [Parapedobacter sp.]